VANLSLVFDLIGRDVSASKAFKNVGDSAERAGKQGENFGTKLAGGLKLAGGALLGAGIIEGFKSLYDAAAESAKIGRLTTQVIKTTGGVANVTAKQVGDLATALSKKTGVDDEVIQSGENLLLTFTNVRNEVGKGNDIFNQATGIITDMSVALGQDTSSSAIQLGKALNDPIKGVTALQRVGVSFTASQKDQIKTLVESGKTMDAQKLILGELTKEFGGAAEAASTPFQKLQVNLGNLAETLGSNLIPYVDRFANFMMDDVLPAVTDVGGVVAGTLGPALGLAVDLFKGLFEVVGGVAHFFNDLPGPLKAVAVSLGAMAVLKGPIGSLFGTLRDTAQTAALRALYLKDSLTGIGGAAGVAKAGASGLMGFFGGPWGLALTGATVGVSLLTSVLGDSSEATKKSKQAAQDYADALREANGVINESVRQAAAKAAQDAGVLDVSKKLGIALPDVTSAITNQGDALDSVRARLKAFIDEHTLHAGPGVRASANALDAEAISAKKALDGLNNIVSGGDKATTSQLQIAEATGKAAVGMGSAKQAADQLMAGLQDTADAAGEARTQTDLFKTSLDILTGQNVSLLQVQSQLQNSLAAATKAMSKEGGAVLDAAGALNLHTENGRKAADVLLDVRNSGNELISTMIQQGRTTAEVTAADANLRAGFVNTARQMGISEAAALKLADQILGIPKERTTQIKADTGQATTAVRNLQAGINNLKGRTVQIKVETSGTGAFTGNTRVMTPGLATGGAVFGPGTGTSDSIPAMLSNGEHVLTAREVKAAGGHSAIQRWRKSLVQAFAAGGPVAPASITAELDARSYNSSITAMAQKVAKSLEPVTGMIGALAFAKSQVGKPYIWGGVGPRGYDCSGFMSAITNVIRGRSPYSRVGSTASFPWGGFAGGYGAFTIGSTPNAGGGIGHMAGTLLGVNVESTGDHVRIGSAARGASNSLFRTRAHLAMANGGVIGEPVSGIGHYSGRSYSFGESGPETVTPGVHTPGTTYVTHVTVDRDADKIARAVEQSQRTREFLHG
jgi:hypothetical protein